MSELLAITPVIIDRPKGSAHPRYPEVIYPLDYGYLENTTASDGGGIDVWLGSLSTAMNKNNIKTLTGILCTFDRLKRDAEINPARFVQKEDVACGVKLLVACTETDVQTIRVFHQEMHTLYIPNPMVVIT
jgi:inorganic pyrophosphatase